MRRIMCYIGIVSISLGIYSFAGKSVLADGIGVVRPRIDITHPNATTVATPFSVLKIVWNKTGRMHSLVKIYLVPASQISPSLPLAGGIPVSKRSGAPNSGMYRWQIPGDLRPGKYAIRIATFDDRVSAFSAVFMIREIKPRCLKVDLVVSKITDQLEYENDCSGWIVVEIKNIRHATSPYPKGPCFYVQLRGYRGEPYGKKYICGADINTLRNTGELTIKFHFIDLLSLNGMKIKAIVDSTEVVEECDETNNIAIHRWRW